MARQGILQTLGNFDCSFDLSFGDTPGMPTYNNTNNGHSHYSSSLIPDENIQFRQPNPHHLGVLGPQNQTVYLVTKFSSCLGLDDERWVS